MNLTIPERLVQKVIDGECGVFIGAGLSAECGLPTWGQLLMSFVEFLNLDKISTEKDEIISLISKGRLIESAEYIKNVVKPRIFDEHITKMLDTDKLKPSKKHLMLLKLKFNSIVTTNFDLLLEQAFSKTEKHTYIRAYDYDNIAALGKLIAEKKPFILKAHGSLSNTNKIIFSRSDYQRLLFSIPSYRSFMRNLLQSRTFLFLGYSLSDPDLSVILEELTTHFEGFGQVHYLLLPTPGNIERKLLESRYNIEVIAYEPSDENHPEVLHFLEGLYSKIKKDDELKKSEELKKFRAQKLESLGVLAGGIAHDFNNIIGNAIGYIQLALLALPDIENNTTLKDYLEEAEKRLKTATEFTRQLLTFARGESPKGQSINLTPLLKESVKFSLKGSNVKPEFTVDENLHNVFVDANQIIQVINNVVINAMQSMPNGGILKVAAKNVSIPSFRRININQGDYILIIIQDKGVGISPEILDKIFDPFFTTKKDGTGLGLSTAYSLVKNHNGHISINSKVKEGTTVEILLPKSIDNEVPIMNNKKRIVRGHGKILFMDDDENTRNMAKTVMEKLGYSVVCVQDGKEAIDLYKNTDSQNDDFDVIILDLIVPGEMGGVETAKILLDYNKKLKIIALSGYSSDPVLINHKEYGFVASITKPYDISELSILLNQLIEKKFSEKY